MLVLLLLLFILAARAQQEEFYRTITSPEAILGPLDGFVVWFSVGRIVDEVFIVDIYLPIGASDHFPVKAQHFKQGFEDIQGVDVVVKLNHPFKLFQFIPNQEKASYTYVNGLQNVSVSEDSISQVLRKPEFQESLSTLAKMKQGPFYMVKRLWVVKHYVMYQMEDSLGVKMYGFILESGASFLEGGKGRTVHNLFNTVLAVEVISLNKLPLAYNDGSQTVDLA